MSSNEIIKNSSIFTSQFLVSTILNLLNKYISKKSIIGDLGSGYGSFLQQFSKLGKRCFANEYDKTSDCILNMFRIFGICSAKHRYDIQEILKLLVQNYDKKINKTDG